MESLLSLLLNNLRSIRGKNMKFANPTTDIAFKKLFCDQNHKDILINFLNSVLKRADGKLITEVNVTEPNNLPENMADKHNSACPPELAKPEGVDKCRRVDVRCIDQKGHHYIVEMQVIDNKNYDQRAQYYACVAVARQLRSTQEYKNLVPVIFVGVVNFNLFSKGKEYLTHHYIRNDENNTHDLQCLEFHFIELPKFNKSLDKLSDVADKWIYMLKNAESMDSVPQEFTNPESLSTAMGILEKYKWSDADLYLYDRMVDESRLEKDRYATALEKGEMKAKYEVAKKMLVNNMNVAEITQLTGLSVEEIETIKK